MDSEDIKNLFEDKYQRLLGQSYDQWLETGPQDETQAYARLQDIDDELKATEDEYQEASGADKEELEDYREKLRNEYQLLEEIYGLESKDANW